MDRHYFGAERAIDVEGGGYGLSYLLIETFAEIFFRVPDGDFFERLIESGDIVGHGLIHTGAIARIVPGDGLQKQTRVANVASEGPDLIETAAVGNQAVARDSAIRRLEAGETAERSRLANRSTGV